MMEIGEMTELMHNNVVSQTRRQELNFVIEIEITFR